MRPILCAPDMGAYYYRNQKIRIRVHPKSARRFKQRLKQITARSNAMSMTQRITKLKQLITGWVNYYGIADMKMLAKVLDEWLRRRIRMCYLKQWKKIRTRHRNLVKRGIKSSKAW